MKTPHSSDLARCIMRFFQDYLPSLRGMSIHTIRSYRDAVMLYLRFAATRGKRRVEALEFEHFTGESVGEFVIFLERERHNGIGTRNARLAALHTFARFAASEYPERLAEMQRVLAVPFKRGAQRKPIEYLNQEEVEALLKTPARPSLQSRRDLALFALMFNTGARVQEVLNLKVRDVRLEPPYQVRLHGKGEKVRICPIWARTAERLRQVLEQLDLMGSHDSPLFRNRRGEKLTRFGVRYLLTKHLGACAESVASLRGRRLHPHSLRHTTAVHLLKAGVDFVTISQWLGHASVNTTMNYARADLDLKRQALAQVFPDVLPPPRAGHVALERVGITEWLRRIG